jgi:hypothetical protein
MGQDYVGQWQGARPFVFVSRELTVDQVGKGCLCFLYPSRMSDAHMVFRD